MRKPNDMNRWYRTGCWTIIILFGQLMHAASADPSPTGHNPKLIWTPDRQAVWNRMKSDYNANPANPATNGGRWFKELKVYADASGTDSERYNDYGQYAAMMYQMTGNTAYATKALSANSQAPKFRDLIQQPPGGPWFSTITGHTNEAREIWVEFLIMYDWLYPALTAADRAKFVTTINTSLDQQMAIEPLEAADADQTFSTYFTMAALPLVTNAAVDNPRASEFINKPVIGGYHTTGTLPNVNTYRNAVNWYINTLAAGGEWITSSEYNAEVELVFLGAESVRTGSGGIDYYPELTNQFKHFAQTFMTQLVPDFSQEYQWGDEQVPRGFIPSDVFNKLAFVSGMLQSDASIGPNVQNLTEALADAYSYHETLHIEGNRGLYTFNPYAPSSDWRSAVLSHYASGQGMVFVHNGWNNSTDSFFGAQFRPGSPVLGLNTHVGRTFGDFQLWRRGEWAITHPIGYNQAEASEAVGLNMLMIAGLSGVEGVRGVVGQEFGTDYTYIAGTMSGKYDVFQTWLPPPDFLYEGTRSLFYLPSTDKKSDTIVVFDRTDAVDPRSLQNATDLAASYDPWEITQMANQAALKQWVIHSPVAPTLAAGSLSWRTARGQNVRVTTLLPQNSRATIYNEATLLTTDTFVPSEIKFQTRVTPASSERWDTFLNVIQAYDTGASLTNQLVTSPTGDVQGVLVKRGGQNDVLALFNAAPAASITPSYTKRLRTSDYQVSFSTAASSTDVYLMDLHPQATWTVGIDGHSSVPASVSQSAIAHFTISGPGNHSLQVHVSGVPGPSTPTGVRVGGGLD